MDKLKALLSRLNESSTVDEIKSVFSELAEILLFESYIETTHGDYRIVELEFYFYNKNHQDCVTINRSEDEGMWWLHEWGVDLSFKSSLNKFYGGVLIRSIIPNKGNSVICGPRNSCWEIFYSSAISTEAQISPHITVMAGNDRFGGKIAQTKRYITGSAKKIDGDYRYFVNDLDIKIDKNYNASPWI
jgi:hypothetical protein